MDFVTPDRFPLVNLCCSSLAGGFGGIVASINVAHKNELALPFIGHNLRLGFLGDMLTGIAASLSLFILADAVIGHNGGQIDALKLVSLGILAGAGGSKLLAGMSNTILRRVLADQQTLESKVSQVERVSELVNEGEVDLREGRYEYAEKVFRRAIALDAHSAVAYLDLAKALKRQLPDNVETRGHSLLQQAINAVSEAIRINPSYDRALYNRACYRALIGSPKKDVLDDLRQAINLFEPYKQFAANDDDFKELANDSEFRKLVT